MKPFVTAIGIATLLMISAGTYAQPYDFTWDGSSCPLTDWNNPNNWDRNSSWPGGAQAGDTATINASVGCNPVVSSSISNAVDWVRLDADAANANLELTIAASITFGDVLLYGDGTYKATFDVNTAPTISADLDATGLVDLEIDADTTVGDELYVGNAAYVNYTTKLGANKLTCGTLDIDARAAGTSNDDTTMKVNAGTLEVSRVATLYASGSNNSDAVLWHAAGTLTVDDIELRGGDPSEEYGDRGLAIAHFDVASNVDPNTPRLEIKDDVYTSGDVEIRCDADVTVDNLYVGSSTHDSEARKQGSSTLTADALHIQSTSSAESWFTVSAGSVSVN